MRIVCCVFTLATVVSATGMDRWSALSMIESGDRDTARGRAGEVSRFQIKPVEWRRVVGHPQGTGAVTGGPPTDARAALAVAQRIMTERSAEFERTHSRPPTDFEFYILWNAPAQVDHPSRAVTARARRFCNLVARPDAGQPGRRSGRGDVAGLPPGGSARPIAVDGAEPADARTGQVTIRRQTKAAGAEALGRVGEGDGSAGRFKAGLKAVLSTSSTPS